VSDSRIEPHLFIIFGATGDLMQRSLLPALFNLASQKKTGEKSIILGCARNPEMNDRKFRDLAADTLSKAKITIDDNVKSWLESSLYYQCIGSEKLEDFAALGERIQRLEKERNLSGNRVFYLALPPIAFPGTIEKLGNAGLNKSRGWTRLVVEKPFGRDLDSALALNRLIHKDFDESQVYRIDHYLGKETVQNLLVFRFANPIFESLWNCAEFAGVPFCQSDIRIALESRSHSERADNCCRRVGNRHSRWIL
jgi:glucose-6-phosphate 1-dehydrogenase